MNLEEAKTDQNVFESNLKKLKKESINQKTKTVHYKILKYSTVPKAELSNYFMVIL